MAEPYFRYANEFAMAKLPQMPDEWVIQPGWTMYQPDGTTVPISAPVDNVYVFDVEVCVKEGHYPTLAVAASDKRWYSWCSNRLCDTTGVDDARNEELVRDAGMLVESLAGTAQLIPLEAGEAGEVPRLVIGHNVAYDRQRVLEQYNLRRTPLRFADTMSLHMATSGLSTQQIQTWSFASIPQDDEGIEALVDQRNEDADLGGLSWVSQSGPPSLAACYKLWCDQELPKESRKMFVKGSMREIRDNAQELMKYCAADCGATHAVFAKVWKDYIQKFPSPVTFAGLMELGSAYLPTNRKWKFYLQEAQRTHDEIDGNYDQLLVTLADDILDLTLSGDWRHDPWLRNLDWDYEVPEFSLGRMRNDGEWAKGLSPRLQASEQAFLPQWYKTLFPGVMKGNADQISHNLDNRRIEPGNVVVPYLCRMYWTDPHWRGPGDPPIYPLHFHPENKWGYLVPHWEATGHKGDGPYEWYANDGQFHRFYSFFKLPSLEGGLSVTGSPFAKEFIKFVDEGYLCSPVPYFRRLYDTVESSRYWLMNRDRIFAQFVVWEHILGPEVNARSMKCAGEQTFNPGPVPGAVNERGILLPTIVPFGTVTRRAVEKTWLTAANPDPSLIGTELKSRIEAPPGYRFVGADVDSQELWIAAVFGDATMGGIHGGSALGWMTLQGSKTNKTDMHSRTADILGITRDQAKIINYARIYGAAENFTAHLLTQFDSNCSASSAHARAIELFRKTKGERIINGPIEIWEGGSESATFNRLEEIARREKPNTPILGAQISTSLQPRHFRDKKDQFLRSRINWVVQSSAVDYLHMLCASMDDLCSRFDIEARYCISIHDEIRYIVAEADVDRAALALHISNMYVRAAFAENLGMNDLPECVAFFSAVDIDTVIRKEVFLDCVTPSNIIPVPPGESVDIHTVGERCGWTLEK